MVVAESTLNSYKKSLYDLERPRTDADFITYCLETTQSRAENAFGVIHETMAVFDCYAHSNVKEHHQAAYVVVREVIESYENAYLAEFHIDLRGFMQKAWKGPLQSS
ncbi:hypothetical protein BKA67DRAFT_536122 [Truncatella angustata]|uniref:Uncharacterized protein n=1 Tax=Truncatella angustata TaxID=152316 RepID=A0A9P8ZY68_9PEZI|nr:uncharacterized protein BKA67DRAFT_536122 [Truncatella angustata]KAH6654828.1 hypothetical protein BKA67DRAFT_536122 [Truncatella angustata]